MNYNYVDIKLNKKLFKYVISITNYTKFIFEKDKLNFEAYIPGKAFVKIPFTYLNIYLYNENISAFLSKHSLKSF